jgi:high mobility group protein B2
MVKNSHKDPNAPKRNLSTYLLYQNAMRDQFKAMNPGMTFGELAKYTSAMYAELPPSEKEVWVARAEADKARYLHELASYLPPPGFSPKGDTNVAAVSSQGGRKGKLEKDSNAPKRNISAYLLYQNAMREQFKRENPGMTFGELAKHTSFMYKDHTPEEKAAWEARAQQDKARYDSELSTYVPPPGHDSRGVLIQDDRPRKRSKREPKDPSAPKRASGAYVFFTNEMRPKIMQEYPGIKFVDMGRLLGERWRALMPEEKKRYEEMAAEDKIRFQKENEQYVANKATEQYMANKATEQYMGMKAMEQPTQHPAPVLTADGYHYDTCAISYDNYEHHDPTSHQAHYDPYAQHNTGRHHV